MTDINLLYKYITDLSQKYSVSVPQFDGKYTNIVIAVHVYYI